MSEELDQYMTKGEKERKDPVEMVNIELLETYSHYNRIYLRSSEEQDYIVFYCEMKCLNEWDFLGSSESYSFYFCSAVAGTSHVIINRNYTVFG